MRKVDPRIRLQIGSIIDPETGCRVWMKFRHCGYGKIRYQRKSWSTHKLAFLLSGKDLPDGFCVLHKCHNRACINIEHLYAGTHKDNTRDMIEAGREALQKGSQNGYAKLTEREVLVIRKLCDAGYDNQHIANLFEISRSQISLIVRRKAWIHV